MYCDDYTRREGGYDWSAGMSNRAVAAYENGAMPKSKWSKQRILSAIIENLGDSICIADREKLKDGLSQHSIAWLRANLLSYDSWHHTSGAYNRTDFYTIKDYGTLEEYIEVLSKSEPKEEKSASVFRMVVAVYGVASKGRRGWSYEDVTRAGVSDGNKFYPLDGYLWNNGWKKVGGTHYAEHRVDRSEIAKEWRKLHKGSIKGLKSYLNRFGL